MSEKKTQAKPAAVKAGKGGPRRAKAGKDRPNARPPERPNARSPLNRTPGYWRKSVQNTVQVSLCANGPKKSPG